MCVASLCRSTGREGRGVAAVRAAGGVLFRETIADGAQGPEGRPVIIARSLLSPFRAGGSARKLFSVGSEKIESVASSFLNLVDEELNEEESVQIPARAAATPVRDRSVPKPLRERAKEHARRASSSGS